MKGADPHRVTDSDGKSHLVIFVQTWLHKREWALILNESLARSDQYTEVSDGELISKAIAYWYANGKPEPSAPVKPKLEIKR